MQATMLFSLYAVPAVVALIAKAGIFFYARFSKTHNLQTRLCLLFLFCMALQNLVEISGFITIGEGLADLWFTTGRLWYSALLFGITLLLHLALVTGTNPNTAQDRFQITLILLYLPVAALVALLWQTQWLITGFQPMGYTITKIPGPFYFLIELHFIGYLCAAIGLFIHGARNQNTPIERLRNKLLLAGFFPFAALVITAVVMLHLGYRKFNVTATGPVALTFFLAVMAYATHQYRLFDIEFFIPWSKVRKRKTAFYKRIQAMIAAVNELDSLDALLKRLANTLQCQVAFVGGARPVAALADGQEKVVIDSLRFINFPKEHLEKVNHIVVAQEIADREPALYASMQQYHVGAIVPFTAYSATGPHWMLLGDRFSHQVYTPLDFRMVEALFAAMADRFLDGFLLARSEAAAADTELKDYKRRLAMAWAERDDARQEAGHMRDMAAAHEQNAMKFEDELCKARAEIARLRREQFQVVKGGLPAEIASGDKTFNQYIEQVEAGLIRKALQLTNGSLHKAARLLGITDMRALQVMMDRYRIDPNEYS